MMSSDTFTNEATNDFSSKTPGVLVLDDDEFVREIEKDILAHSGFRVFATGDAAKAIDMFTENEDRIDLVITDYSIPERNGKEVCDSIKETNSEMPVMLVSGAVGSLARSELEEFARIMDKPFHLDEFVENARALVNG